MAVPIAAIVVLAANSLRDEAVRLEVASSGYRALCSSLGEEIPADKKRPDLIPWVTVPESQDCLVGSEFFSKQIGAGVTVPAKPVRPENAIPRQVMGADSTMTCLAEYHSGTITPEFSSWPLTDPRRIRARLTTATGETGVGDLTGGWLPEEHQARLAGIQRALNAQVLFLLGGAAVLIGLFGGVVWLATGRVLQPVEAIRREMAEITEQDLTRRVPVPRGRTEIAGLATTVNATLERLEAAVEDNRRFVADASHELRTPIAALRAELEIATTYPDLADWPAVADAALADTQRLQHLAGDLLLLARLDHASTTPTSTAGQDDTVDLTALTREQTERHRSRHTLTTLVPDRAVPVRGSRFLLDRLLGNLLDNAERHATATITIRLTATADQAVLEVLDDGPGIPPEHRDRIFDRFTRLDHARTDDTGGTGLGLPIARRIATVHAGTLRATDPLDDHGARLVATFPLTR
ncbi:HAMP domain-containing histidine kinase [Saccharothrix syringae]|uniref:histidine kinase n=2 Tax=Saccharothrix syringae TaxID=103733 RepID=A0A5Q0HDZ4_SACSY|nr:HAMP domain-containing histidine kinase [Saccharothrix syringae]